MAVLEGELGCHAPQNVADVGHPLAQVVVFNLGEKAGVFLERFLKGRAGIHVPIQDGGPDLLDQRRIAKQQPMRPENAGLFFAHFLADPTNNSVQLLGRCGTGIRKPIHLTRQGRCVQAVRLLLCQQLIHAISPADCYSRRYRHSAPHESHFSSAWTNGQRSERRRSKGEFFGVRRWSPLWFDQIQSGDSRRSPKPRSLQHQRSRMDRFDHRSSIFDHQSSNFYGGGAVGDTDGGVGAG